MRFLVNGRFLSKQLTGVARVGQEMLRALLAEMAETPRANRPSVRIAAPPGISAPGADAAGASIAQGPGNLIGEQILLPWLDPGATILSGRLCPCASSGARSARSRDAWLRLI